MGSVSDKALLNGSCRLVSLKRRRWQNGFVQGEISFLGPCTGNGSLCWNDVQGLALVFPPCTLRPMIR